MKNKSKKNILLYSSIIFILSIALFLYLYFQFNYKDHNNYINLNDSVENINDSINFYSEDFIKSVLNEDSSDNKTIHYSSINDYKKSIQIDSEAGKNIKRIYQGRRINIAVTGIDARLGDSYKHADANHVISVLLDSGKIEIISIPRDTYADCGYDDTTNLNKLTVFRAVKGRKAYLDELANIAQLDKIHYYVEFGFSQAIGLIELLGYKNPKSTLKVLRSRVGLGGDDYQRVYNQAQFIRQNILKNWNLLNSFTGDILIRAALILTDNNLSYDILNNIKETLNQNNFAMNNENIKIRVRPPIPINYKIYDLTDIETLQNLSRKIDDFNSRNNKDSILKNPDISEYVYNRINNIIIKYKENNSNSLIKTFEIYFEQKAWLQIEDIDKREEIKNTICDLLLDYYTKRKMTNKANNIQNFIEFDKKVNKVITDLNLIN